MSTEEGPEGKEYYYSLVDEYLDSGQTGRALIQAIKNIAYNEDDPVAYINRARVYEKIGALENAIRDLQEALRVSPGHAKAKACLERIQKKLSEGASG
jgi:tetratricopeptide (TPR) repeat protein